MSTFTVLQPPAKGNTVRLTKGPFSGHKAEVTDKRGNGLYSVRVLEGVGKGATVNVTRFEMELCHE